MDFCFLKGGAASFLQARLNDSWPSGGKDLKLKLYTNTVALVNTLTAASFTEVASEAGYTAKDLVCGSWEIPSVILTAAFIAEARYAPQAFVFTDELTDSLTVKGYFITDADDVALWAYEFDTPFVPEAGLTLGVYPKINISKKSATYSQRLFDIGALSFLSVRLNDTWPESEKNLVLIVFGTESAMAYEFVSDQTASPTTVYDSSLGPITATLSCGGWTVDSTPTATYTQQTWTFTDAISQPSGGYINGYELGNGINEIHLGVAFSAGYQPGSGDTLYITPTITLTDGTPT